MKTINLFLVSVAFFISGASAFAQSGGHGGVSGNSWDQYKGASLYECDTESQGRALELIKVKNDVNDGQATVIFWNALLRYETGLVSVKNLDILNAEKACMKDREICFSFKDANILEKQITFQMTVDTSRTQLSDSYNCHFSYIIGG